MSMSMLPVVRVGAAVRTVGQPTTARCISAHRLSCRQRLTFWRCPRRLHHRPSPLPLMVVPVRHHPHPRSRLHMLLSLLLPPVLVSMVVVVLLMVVVVLLMVVVVVVVARLVWVCHHPLLPQRPM